MALKLDCSLVLYPSRRLTQDSVGCHSLTSKSLEKFTTAGITVKPPAVAVWMTLGGFGIAKPFGELLLCFISVSVSFIAHHKPIL